MSPVELTYGNEAFKEIRSFLQEHYQEDYTLSIYDIASQATIEVKCSFEDIVDAILYVSTVEKDFPAWIGVNELSNSYVVGINFSRGQLHTPSICEYKNGKFKIVEEF